MPDCHSGYGMPIGGVLATKDVIIPNAVGVDIGCGMVADKTDLQEITTDQIKQVIGKVREVIPVGFKHQQAEQWDMLVEGEEIRNILLGDRIQNTPIVYSEVQKEAGKQLGTLGGGNHFIEIQKGNDGHIWLMIHSGSRNVGKKVCDFYNKKAAELNTKFHSSVPSKWELAFFPVDSVEGRSYIAEMNWCLDFARANRDLMMDRLIDILSYLPGGVEILKRINVHHNYAALENHFGSNVWVHRKGAIRMREGEMGIIPGSMGTPSYIVEGLGNKESFMSASHGAGRVMSRKKANEIITEEMAQEAMQGIIYGRFNGQYDECPQAYKNIDDVIANEADLVKPLVKLQPLGVVKG
jgi:tRNA-splicing ligase RtcB